MLMIISCSAAPIVAASTWRSAADRSLQPAATQPANHVVAQCPDAVENPLPLPTSMSPDEFHARLLAFLKNAEYAKLLWCVDKTVRDTGPYVYQEYLGTHPAVRCFYSPAVMRWLISGRIDDVPDGAMIVKEMYFPGPAARYEGKPLAPQSWTVMIKDSKGAKDGWFWGGLWADTPPMPSPSDSYKPPFPERSEGFGLTCLHCHASSEKESTFASLNNIKGFPGNPLSFFVDETWRNPPPPESKTLEDISPEHRMLRLVPSRVAIEMATHAEFLRYFANVPIPGGVQRMPAETYDHVVVGRGGAETFITSDGCMSCHSGNAWYGAKYTMILEGGSKNAVNVSPYGEWRWSPMGLAGRDPIFFAQLDSELAFLADRPEDQQKVVNICFRCHGVMGKRQLDADHGYDAASPNNTRPEPDFKLDWIQNTDVTSKDFKYGALARDGVSCASCHHIVPDKTPAGEDPLNWFLDHQITGQFTTGSAAEIFGPFEDKEIAPHPMKAALDITPKYLEYIKDSRLCGNCHTIKLPVLDKTSVGHSVEQATYIEWLNSEFQTEFNPGPNAKSCQACHMPTSYANAENNMLVKQIQTAFADVQDDTYPAAEHTAPMDQIRARFREKGFARHQLQGLNVFLIEMFNQFMTGDDSKPPNFSNSILGVRKSDYMSTLDNDLQNAVSNFVQAARYETATIEVTQAAIDANTLSAEVTVTNKTGHRFPSGVGFRRAFIRFDVMDGGSVDPRTKQPTIVWSSGGTNEAGFIVDSEGRILESEYIGTNRGRKGPAQPHFWGKGHPITSSGQVQIYEELVRDAEGNYTTSFLRRNDIPKDNRLLPRGWSKDGGALKSVNDEFLHATLPEGDAANDPAYLNGSGTSVVRYEVPLSRLAKSNTSQLTVKATLYYQSIPPYYLTQRFEQAPHAPATQRLFYLTSRLNTTGTPIEGWKLLIAATPARRLARASQ